MKMRQYRFWLDVAIGVAFLAEVASSLILWLRNFAGANLFLLGLSRQEWGALHRLSSVVLILGVIAHLLIHWKWIKGVVHLRAKPIKVRRHVWIDWGLMILFLLALATGTNGPQGLSVSLTLAIHLIAGMTMMGVILAHFWFHWSWITSTVVLFRKKHSDELISATAETSLSPSIAQFGPQLSRSGQNE